MATKGLTFLFQRGSKTAAKKASASLSDLVGSHGSSLESETPEDSMSAASILAAEALAEAARLNDLYVAAAAEAYSARSEADVLREQLANSQEFGARAYSEAQRINALLLDAQAEAASLRARAETAGTALGTSDDELDEIRDLLQAKIRESQERFDYAQVAWKEAARINDLFVEASRRAVTAEQSAAALELRLEKLAGQRSESTPALQRASVVERSGGGPAMRGAWDRDLEFDQDLKALADFVTEHRTDSKHPDVAVLLMFPGWETELRGNRWHVAKFLSTRMPVILVQPAQLYARGGPQLVPERRIKNVWILETLIHQPHWHDECDEAFLHSRDIAWAIQRLGGTWPLYWLFSPYLAKAFVGLPGGQKLVHATEDWVDFPGLASWAKANFNEALATADLVVAVSDGVRQNLIDRVDRDRLITVANGCDYAAYSRPEVHRTFRDLRRDWSKIAIFAGNIDYRIDFCLLKKAAETQLNTLFALVGPVRTLDSDDAALWRSILKLDNVRWFGPFDPDLLPRVYAGADIGMIPYKKLDFIVRSNFSLKLLEMAAAGLPVVTTAMDSVRGLAAALIVTNDTASFLAALGQLGRRSITSQAAEELQSVAAANDYTKKFEAIIKELENRERRGGEIAELCWSDYSEQSAMWRASLNALAAGDTSSARAGLLRTARTLRVRLGRRHPTACKALVDLSKSLTERPLARLRMLSAALQDSTRDLNQSPAFRAAAAAHCSAAVSNQRYADAVWSGRRAWAAVKEAPELPNAPPDLLPNLLTALVETNADPREVESILTSMIDGQGGTPATGAHLREVVGRYLERRKVAKEPRKRIARSLELLVHPKQ